MSVSDVAFDGGGSHDPDGRITSYEWSFGDGATATGPAVTPRLRAPRHLRGGARRARRQRRAAQRRARHRAWCVVNAAPIADAGPDLSAAPGEELVLDGSGSVDPDGAVAGWAWAFPDGSEARGRPGGAQLRRAGAVPRPADRPRRQRAAEAFDTDEMVVAVNAPPVAIAGPDLLVAPGAPVRFDGGSSFDPDGRIVVLALGLRRPRGADPGAGRRAHLRRRPASAPRSSRWRTRAAPPTRRRRRRWRSASTTRRSPTPGRRSDTDTLYVTLDGSASSDADGDRLIHTWDFGDGSPPALGETVTHAYPRSGVFPVTLTRRRRHRARQRHRVRRDPRRHRRPPGGGRRRQPRRLLGRRDPLRRQRLQRPGRRAPALPLGLRRRHPRRGRQPEQDLRGAGRLHRDPDRAGRIRLAARRAFRPHRRRGARGADRHRRAAAAGLHQPDRALRRLEVRRRRRRGQRLLVELRRRLDRRRRAPDPRLRAPRQLPGHADHHRRRPRQLRRARHRHHRRDRGRGAAPRHPRPRPRRRRGARGVRGRAAGRPGNARFAGRSTTAAHRGRRRRPSTPSPRPAPTS